MNVTRDEVVDYLNEVKKSVEEGRYQISSRTKNQCIYIDYVFSEQRCKEILLDLEADDFSEAVQNDHPQHPEEILYIFGKQFGNMSRGILKRFLDKRVTLTNLCTP